MKAVELFGKAMEIGLSKAYVSHFEKGSTLEFSRLVGERDNNLGLPVKFPEISEHRLVYQFHTDPFPGLKN